MKSNTALKLLTIAFAVAVVGIGLLAFEYYNNVSYMTLNGDKNVTVSMNGVYNDPGVTAFQDGEDVSSQVEITGKPADFTEPGEYTVVYRSGNFTLDRKITVAGEMDPVIELKGKEEGLTFTLGDEFEEPGYTATDSNGKDITDKVIVTGNEFKIAGTQKVAYTVSDSDGKMTRVFRTVTVEPNTEYSTSGVPICMYHYVYDENDPPDSLNANYISTAALSEELAWLVEHEYYFPTWQELKDYIDGRRLLPEKSVVITFDNASRLFLENGLPLLEKYKIPATCFVVTSKNGKQKMEQYQSDYLVYQSESDNMYRGGGKIGHGGIFTALSHDEALADLKKSIEIIGSDEAFAYPYGDYNDDCVEIVKEAGFMCAVTTRQGRVKPGDDPLRLPRQRMAGTQTMETFRTLVLPY